MMKLLSPTTNVFRLIITAMVLVFLFCGCSSKEKNLRPLDKGLHAWKEKAKRFEGYSPDPDFTERTLDQTSLEDLTESQDKSIEQEKLLPTTPVTIKVSNVPAGVIIATLARKENINILNTEKIAGNVNLNLQRVPWDQVFNTVLRESLCTYEWEGDVLRILNEEDMKNEAKLAELLLQKKGKEKKLRAFSPVETKIVKIQFAEIQDIQKTLEETLRQQRSLRENENENREHYRRDIEASVIQDKHTNSLILRGKKDEVELMVRLIKAIDIPTSQINIKAYIVETTQETGRDLGLQWDGRWRSQPWGNENHATISPLEQKENIKGNIFESFLPDAAGASGIGAAGLGLGVLVGNLSDNFLELQLAALEKANKANILSNPSITTIDNVMAYTENGEKIPYVTVDDGEKSVEFEEAVLRLEITPHVIDSRYLKMDIKIKKDEVDMSRKVENNPLIVKKETQTTLIVENNETIVISGLTKTAKGQATQGVPGIKDAPLLGWLFKGQASQEKMHDVLIFITPKVLPKRSDGIATKIDTLEKLEKLVPTNDLKALKWKEKSKKMLEEKTWDEVIRAASIALALDPGLESVYCDRAHAYLEKGDLEKSYDDTLTVLYMNKRNARAYRLQGLVFEEMGKNKKALESLEKGCGLGDNQACEEHKRLYYKGQKVQNSPVAAIEERE